MSDMGVQIGDPVKMGPFKPDVIFTLAPKYEKPENVGHSWTLNRFVYFYRHIRHGLKRRRVK